LFPLFAAVVVDTGDNLPPASLTPAANLPPVSLTLVANLPPVSLIKVANLPPVSLTCEYLREFSEKFETIQMLFSGAWGKVIHEKTLKQKIS
jgi:hypothetical protein